MKDEKELKEALESYYGTAAVNGFPAALSDLYELDEMSEEELEELAKQVGIDG